MLTKIFQFYPPCVEASPPGRHLPKILNRGCTFSISVENIKLLQRERGEISMFFTKDIYNNNNSNNSPFFFHQNTQVAFLILLGMLRGSGGEAPQKKIEILSYDFRILTQQWH